MGRSGSKPRGRARSANEFKRLDCCSRPGRSGLGADHGGYWPKRLPRQEPAHGAIARRHREARSNSTIVEVGLAQLPPSGCRNRVVGIRGERVGWSARLSSWRERVHVRSRRRCGNLFSIHECRRASSAISRHVLWHLHPRNGRCYVGVGHCSRCSCIRLTPALTTFRFPQVTPALAISHASSCSRASAGVRTPLGNTGHPALAGSFRFSSPAPESNAIVLALQLSIGLLCFRIAPPPAISGETRQFHPLSRKTARFGHDAAAGVPLVNLQPIAERAT